MKKNITTFLHYSMIRISLIVIILGIFMGSGVAIVKNMATRVTAADNSQLSYHSVSVSTGDTLWSVAKDHYTQEWGSFSDYLKEIKRCNALSSEEITAGSSLVVPVYLPLDSVSVNAGMESIN